MRVFMLLCAVLLANHASAEERTKAPRYAQVGAWEIRIDDSMGNGCFAAVMYGKDTALRIGFDNSGKTERMYIYLGNYQWKSLETGKKYDITMTFGNQHPWKGRAVGHWMGDLPSFQITIGGDLFQHFMEEQYVVVRYRGQVIANLKLNDSWMAGRKIVECQQMIRDHERRNPPRQTDPFSVKSRDPFAL